MNEARQTPLPDLLDQVPEDIVLGIPGDEPVFPSYTNIPIGKHARQAAAELRRLHASCEDYAQHKQRQDQRVLELAERVLELKAQRDALLEALRTLLSYAFTLEMRLLDADGEHRAMQKARAAIKAVEGEKS